MNILAGKQNVGCKKCGTVLGESITEWKSETPNVLNLNIEIQPYLSLQIKDWIMNCPTCSNKVDFSILDSILPPSKSLITK